VIDEDPRHLRGVLDTSTLLMLPRITEPAGLPAEPCITTVTLAELSVGPLVATSDAERAARQAYVQQAEADF
jgi:tRNA(fMet)-specific endonuclease VapC